MALQITHCQKISATAPTGNRKRSTGEKYPEIALWLILSAAPVEGGLVLLPRIPVSKPTFDAFGKTLNLNVPVSPKATHCQCIDYHDRAQGTHSRLWHISHAPEGAEEFSTVAVLNEEGLADWLPLIQEATPCTIVDVWETEPDKAITRLRLIRAGMAEYQSWLVFKDLRLLPVAGDAGALGWR